MTYSIPLPDHRLRPKAPKIDGVTDLQRRHGRRLAQFHAMHLSEMARVRRLLDHVVDGTSNATELAEAAGSIQMISNFRLFGNMCGSTCEMLNAHHSIEDAWIFPGLRDRSEGLRALIDRLAMEHGVIHQMLVDMEEAAIALLNTPGPAEFEKLKSIFSTLEAFVISHFGYEQEELEEALGYYDIDI